MEKSRIDTNCNNNVLPFKKEVCEVHNSRMSRKDKKNFREWAVLTAESMGYNARVENNIFANNIVVGNTEKAEIIYGAHYDTPPAMSPFIIKHQILTIGMAYPIALIWSIKGAMNFTAEILPTTIHEPMVQFIGTGAQLVNFGVFGYMLGFMGNANTANYDDNSSGVISVLQLMDNYKNLPQEEKDKVAFVLFDNEEKMLWGSMSYATKHKKEIKHQTVINMDCVGVANTMNLLYVGGKKQPQIVKDLQTEIQKTSLSPKIKTTTPFSMSDHISFIGAKEHVCLLAKDKSLYSLVSHIHSKNDTEIKDQNIIDVVNSVKSFTDKRLFSNKKQLTQKLNKDEELVK